VHAVVLGVVCVSLLQHWQVLVLGDQSTTHKVMSANFTNAHARTHSHTRARTHARAHGTFFA
jgi:hypothetical protein